MLLVYTQKHTSRIDYIFKHICTRILGISVTFTNRIEEFIAHDGAKISYGKQQLGNELFFHSHGLLQEQGIEDIEINVRPWGDTVGFFTASEKSALPFEIFSASFFLLSRYEEYLPHVKDELGRFTAKESVAHVNGFLEVPVIDVWAYKFKDVLLQAFPKLLFPKKTCQIHNLVDAKRPFEFAQRGLIRNCIGFLSDIYKFKLRRFFLRARVLLYLRKDPYDTFNWLLNTSKNSKSKLTVFFLLGEAYSFREDFNTNREQFRDLIKHVGDYAEVGLFFSFLSLNKPSQLKNEKQKMEDLTHRSLTSTINDKQVLSLPFTYRSLIELEIERDYSMFFYDQIGFRASTCTPFLFYDLDNEIKTPLTIHPVIGKSLTLFLSNESDIEGRISSLLKEVRKVNGTFSFLLSNRDFVQKKENKVWRYLFSEKLNEE